ncbi:sodium/glutamate symporter [Clostridium transplantifaecale]|uniref:sodium/glutamate symporter n=1 Tax=Clostridium transplantifaecale TaxID=2479838 RepID=UPI000F639E6A|nr:sodium/glutamate symporter [Clostridium transplantifaecale]
MGAQIVDSVFTLSFDSIGTMTLGAILLLIGYWIKGRVYFLEKFYIPAPVVGAFLIDVFYQPFVIWCINVLC